MIRGYSFIAHLLHRILFSSLSDFLIILFSTRVKETRITGECFQGFIKICAICKHITLSCQILFYRKTKLSSAMACHICDWYHLWPKCGYSGSFHHINRKCVVGGGWHCFGPDRFWGLLIYSNSVPLQSAEVSSTGASQSCITKLYFWIALFVKYNILIRDGKYGL